MVTPNDRPGGAPPPSLSVETNSPVRRRVHQAGAIAFAALGAHVVLGSFSWPIVDRLGPGPGFFPLLTGSLLALLATVWLVQVSLGPILLEGPDEVAPHSDGLARIGSVLLILVGYAFLLEELGFLSTTFLFITSLQLVFRQRSSFLLAAGASLITAAFATGAIFALMSSLGIPLPASSIELLRTLGL